MKQENTDKNLYAPFLFISQKVRCSFDLVRKWIVYGKRTFRD